MINVDKTITISLKNREDRREIAEKEIAKLNLKTEFMLTERDTENTERGCFHSHVNAAKNALYEGSKAILVFEDDVKILPFSPHQILAINKFLQDKAEKFDLLYLGLILGQLWYCGSKSIVRARGACTHAYILSLRGIKKMAALQYENLAIDEVIKRDFKCYSVYPMIAEQYPEDILSSDITSLRNQRKNRRLKDKQFWKNNYDKQTRRLWGNFHRTFLDMLATFQTG